MNKYTPKTEAAGQSNHLEQWIKRSAENAKVGVYSSGDVRKILGDVRQGVEMSKSKDAKPSHCMLRK